MEKNETSPPMPLQGKGTPNTEERINSLLGVIGTKNSEPDLIGGHESAGKVRRWKFGKKSSIPFRQRKLLYKEGRTPETIEHIPNGKRRGCICSSCMDARGEFEIVSPEAVHAHASNDLENNIPDGSKTNTFESASSSAPKPIELDTIVSDFMDEELAGVLLDTFREVGLMKVRSLNLGKDVERIWQKDEKEIEILGRSGKRVWDKYAHLPNFKYKDEMILGLQLTRVIGLRVWATSSMQKKNEEVPL
jgi:hypothetical protein